MRKTIAWFVVGFLVLVAAWWLLFWAPRAPSTAEQFAALRAAGAMVSPAERCAGYQPSPQRLTLWTARLAEAERRLRTTDDDPVLVALADEPLAFWSALDWALDATSWKDADAPLERAASESAELAELYRTIGEYQALDLRELLVRLPASQFHPAFDMAGVLRGRKAAALSLLRSARRGDLDAMQRDLEAQLLAVEKLQTPVSLVGFDLWGLLLADALDALEGSLPTLAGRLDAAALERRLGALEPRSLLVESLILERSHALGQFEWSLERLPRGRSFGGFGDLVQTLLWSPARELEDLTRGFELGLRHVRGEGVSVADLERYQGQLDPRAVLSRALMPKFQEQAELALQLEMRLALARSALRLQASGRQGWEDVPRELDPRTGAPLLAEPLDDAHLRLRAVKPGAAPEEQRALEWTVLWR